MKSKNLADASKEITSSQPSGLEIIPIPPGISIERDVMVGMADGIRIAVNIFRPEKDGRFPVIMAMTPYGKDIGPQDYPELEYQARMGIENGTIRISALTTFEAPDPAYWTPKDYVVIYADCRGTGHSEGKQEMTGPKEIQDFYDLIEWAAVQEWSNGRVGLCGVSYLAINQWYVSVQRPPHLKAIIPWEGMTDRYRDRDYQGGIPETVFRMRFLKEIMRLPPDVLDGMITNVMDPVRNQGQKNLAPKLEEIEVPALICASWSDKNLHTRGSFEGYRRISSKKKWLYTHGGIKWDVFYSEDALNHQNLFFDYYLKNLKNKWPETAAVRLEIREEVDIKQVRFENEWPIARTRYVRMYLNPSDRSLSFDPISSKGIVKYIPVSGGDASFGMCFDEDTELTGYMKLKIWVSAEDADDMDLFVAVKKFDALGNEIQFRGMNGWRGDVAARGQMRVSQRELNERLSTLFQPVQKFDGEKKLQPGEIVPVEIALLPSSTLFRKGESLRLYIQGREPVVHPMIGYRHPHNPGVHVIHAGDKYDSFLQVPVIP
jgi:predicted acyl esterase